MKPPRQGCLWAIAVLLLAQSLCSAQARYDNYTLALRRTLLLSNEANTKLLPLGKSAQNRAIPALVIGDFHSDPSGKVRVLVCAGQHGDEPNPVWSALRLIEKLSSRRDTLSRCVFIVAPMVNPDGLSANRRLNSRGIDLNRDWATQHSAETQFINGLIKSWQPHVIFDLHEWPVAPSGPANTIEAPLCAGERQRYMNRVAIAGCHATGLSLVSPDQGSNPSLLGRHYTAHGYAAFMVETGPSMSQDAKTQAYIGAVLGVVGQLGSRRVDTAALSPSSRGLAPAVVAAYFAAPAGGGPNATEPLATAAILIAAYFIAMFAARRPSVPERPEWSRAYTRCEVAEGVKTDPWPRRRTLVPLTARSWTRRRLRSRASGSPSSPGRIAPASSLANRELGMGRIGERGAHAEPPVFAHTRLSRSFALPVSGKRVEREPELSLGGPYRT